MINGIKTFARENKSEIFYFTVLLIALLVIAIPKWQLQHSINISNWDSYIYLDNGRSFAGMGWGDLPQIAPFVSCCQLCSASMETLMQEQSSTWISSCIFWAQYSFISF